MLNVGETPLNLTTKPSVEKPNAGMKQGKSAQKLLQRTIPLIKLPKKEAPQLLFYQSF
jgi:hypothetical protein